MTNVARRRAPFRIQLWCLAAACTVPLVILCTVIALANDRLRLERIDRETLQWAQNLSADVDRELGGIESALKVLSSTPDLAPGGDLGRFHAQASAALTHMIVNNVLLTDQDGVQRLNTLLPFGQPLPTSGTPEDIKQVFAQARPVLTDLFVGPVTGTHLVAIGVPVQHEGAVTYSLNIGLSPDRLGRVIDMAEVSPAWTVALLDRTGTIITRSRDAKRYVGEKAVPELLAALSGQSQGRIVANTKDGVPSYVAYHRSPRTGWTVVVGVPIKLVDVERQRAAMWEAGAVLAALCMAALATIWFVRGLSQSAGGDQP